LAAAALVWWLSPAGGPKARLSAEVAGRVELAADAGAATPPSATVVVYAYALDGPRVPLAVMRRPAASLPFEFKLDDSLAPKPAFRLSQAPRLVVGARLGPGDDTSPQPGDWLAPSQTVSADAKGVRLVLRAPRP
jgi:cytochrome c-type biogenesis protein CcmH